MTSLTEASRGVESVLKWPGGKRWIAPLVSKLATKSLRNCYFEPFLGSGAVFFNLAPPRSVLSDINSELIETLQTLRAEPRAVLAGLGRLSNTKDCYYTVRARCPQTPIGRAVRFIYLTRTCWGGIYRLNRKREFNVPFGNSGRVICRKNLLISAAGALRPATLRVADFEDAIITAGEGDVVYADPPYTTLGENNGFLRYNEHLFAWDDQVRLANCCREINRKGGTAIVSGLCHQSVLSLYYGWWVIKVRRHSTVSRLASGHRLVTEVLITNTEPPRDLLKAAVIERIHS
jgi:DNA adenine methylase